MTAPAWEARAWPPPPHDPRERAQVLTTVGGWELRRFADDDLRRTYLAMRGMDHVQLWHPRARVSLLSPSRLTAGAFELFPIAGWKRRAPDLVAAARLVRAEHGVDLPVPSALLSLERWFLVPAVRGACEVAR